MSSIDTKTLKTAFNTDGFVQINDFLSQDELKTLKDKLDEFTTHITPTMRPEHVLYENQADPKSLKQMFHLADYDPFFDEMVNSSKFRQLAEALLADEITSPQVEYFNKPAGIGKPTPPHQDSFYFMLTPPVALTFWLPLEDVDEENGCLHYIRGSHKKGMRPHGRTNILGFSQGMTDFGTKDDKALDVAMPVKAGEVLIHHGMTIHYANGNDSPTRSRRVLGLVYFAASAKEDRAAKEAYLKILREETSKI